MGIGSHNPKRTAGAGSATKRATAAWGDSGPANGCTGELAEVPGLGETLQRIADAGDALIVGKTSDGTAFALVLLDGKTKPRRYPGTQEALDRAFAELAQLYDPDA